MLWLQLVLRDCISRDSWLQSSTPCISKLFNWPDAHIWDCCHCEVALGSQWAQLLFISIFEHFGGTEWHNLVPQIQRKQLCCCIALNDTNVPSVWLTASQVSDFTQEDIRTANSSSPRLSHTVPGWKFTVCGSLS